jgi:hypothetical protein
MLFSAIVDFFESVLQISGRFFSFIRFTPVGRFKIPVMQISLTHFKSLLHTVKAQQISLKVKTHTGWSSDFLHIIGFIASSKDQENRTFTGLVLSNSNETEGILINNISSITAFQLSTGCEEYKPDIIYLLADTQSEKALMPQ